MPVKRPANACKETYERKSAAAHPPQYAYRLLNHPPPGAVVAAVAAAAAGARAALEIEEQMAKAEMEINKDVNRTFSALVVSYI